MATLGEGPPSTPVLPWYGASPKRKTPPSEEKMVGQAFVADPGAKAMSPESS